VDITRILAMLASQDEELQKELQENANLSAQSVVSQPVSPLDSDVIAVASLRPDTELLEPLLKSDQWPQAVNEYLICDLNSEDDKDARAQGIIAAMIDPDLTGKKFLDFGCGEGHVVNEAAQTAAFAGGYDIVQSKNVRFKWEEQERSLLTTNFEKIRANGPYNVILIYDVLDYVEDPVATLKLAAEVLGPDGVMKIRFHPWCSRHGGNLYREINKAFVHLVFSEEELKKMGYTLKFNQKVIYPVVTYRKWITGAGLLIKDEFSEKNTVEDFFKNHPLVSKKIKNHWNSGTFPLIQTEQSFVEYTVTN
jgi:2-polyprenyl-3-methyl-5-hydroxy-6-metoxy-1,4-benzoquinol methylase